MNRWLICMLLTALAVMLPAQAAFPASDKPAPGQKEYSIFIYMNGSDLETGSGQATADLLEMMDSGFDSSRINLVVMTGGTMNWKIPQIRTHEFSVFEITPDNPSTPEYEGKLTEVSVNDKKEPDFGIGNPSILTEFLDFSFDRYPANHYGLILWNHGQGAVIGYGWDDFQTGEDKTLTLDEIKDAVGASKHFKSGGQKFDFFGYDACLMASVEAAHAASNYADYLFASEELEPLYGWYYTDWLSFLSESLENNTYSPVSLGNAIMDDYLSGYQAQDQATFSIIDLKGTEKVRQSLNRLADWLYQDWEARPEQDEGANALLRVRRNTLDFGVSHRMDKSYDMIDLVSFAQQVKMVYPEAEALSNDLEAAVSSAVIGSGDRGVPGASGLSAYFPYRSQSNLIEGTGLLKTYAGILKNLGFCSENRGYSRLVTAFGTRLVGVPAAFRADFKALDPRKLYLVIDNRPFPIK